MNLGTLRNGGGGWGGWEGTPQIREKTIEIPLARIRIWHLSIFYLVISLLNFFCGKQSKNDPITFSAIIKREIMMFWGMAQDISTCPKLETP